MSLLKFHMNVGHTATYSLR